MTTKIIGVDVSRLSITVCPAEKRINEPEEYYLEAEFLDFPATKQGIANLLALKADIAIIEPTGVAYSKLWIEHLVNAGCEVRLVDHAVIKNYRRFLGLTDKTDRFDALTLACYGWDNLDRPSKFLTIKPPEIEKLRSLRLRLNNLNKIQSPTINRFKQDLNSEFPEVAKKRIEIRRKNNKPDLLLCWLLGKETSNRYDNKLQESCGLGISPETITHAKILYLIHEEELRIEAEMTKIITKKEYQPYLKVFNKFYFGFRTQCLLLSQIYPFEKFLGDDNKPIVRITKGRVNKKPTKKRVSLAKFFKNLGCAPSEFSSGETKRKRVFKGNRK